MRKLKIKKLIPSKLKKSIIILNTRFISFLILNSKIFRDLFIKKTINNFIYNKEFSVSNKCNKWTIGSFWDSDGRFKWMKDICQKEKVNIIHIPRELFRNVFAHLFYFQGYTPNEFKGEIPLNIFYDKKFIKQREKYNFYCKEVAKSIAYQFKVDIFLAFKLNDDWIIDVLKGINKSNLPVVVHDREHGITPKRMEYYPPYLNSIINDLKVDKICTSNKTHYIIKHT